MGLEGSVVLRLLILLREGSSRGDKRRGDRKEELIALTWRWIAA